MKNEIKLAIMHLKDLLRYSDRLGSDELFSIKEVIKILQGGNK